MRAKKKFQMNAPQVQKEETEKEKENDTGCAESQVQLIGVKKKKGDNHLVREQNKRNKKCKHCLP